MASSSPRTGPADFHEGKTAAAKFAGRAVPARIASEVSSTTAPAAPTQAGKKEVSLPLEYAPANLRRPKGGLGVGVAITGTVLNYAAVLSVVGWSGIIIDKIVAANGAAKVWEKPDAYSHQALDVPGYVGIACTITLTAIFTVLLIRRRVRVLAVLAFILVNLLAIIVMGGLLENGAMSHDLYP